ncbi:daunorubicin resistance ABC transporter ATP-binding subunit [Thaumarchaeota archaeon SCGC AB-539-E09]|nr:daunorubicin resistance ABC transporter ATP-binding subunit [Thaumarchaeota archaeon SCGC AB-539-E09]
MTVIHVDELTKIWGKTRAVDGISFNVEEGEIFGFLGPNGAGKTTTIKMLVGLTKPSSGSAIVAGYDVVKEPTLVKKRIGVVPESSNLYDELSIYKNLRFVSKLYHVPSVSREKRIKELLEIFQLTDYQNSPFGKLSKGLKRRTVLSAALLHEPEIVFLDEPTSGLDVMSARNLRQVISELSESRVTIFFTTHYIEEAGELCDRIALIVKGKIIEVESPEVLRGRIQDVPLLKIRLKDGSRVKLSDLKEVPAEDIQLFSDNVSILTRDVHESLKAFMRLAEEKGVIIQDVHTIKPSLEDAFIQLTGLTPDSMRMEKEVKR